jgi:hypothetical protein
MTKRLEDIPCIGCWCGSKKKKDCGHWVQTIAEIHSVIEGLIPETENDTRTGLIYQYNRGYNKAIAEIRRRLNGLKGGKV